MLKNRITYQINGQILLELAKNNNRQDMVEKHINILNKYEEILGNIKDGNIIFGRSNRIKV